MGYKYSNSDDAVRLDTIEKFRATNRLLSIESATYARRLVKEIRKVLESGRGVYYGPYRVNEVKWGGVAQSIWAKINGEWRAVHPFGWQDGGRNQEICASREVR